MRELWLIRHAQASFGAADYDKLSGLGHDQSRALGQALARLGMVPDAVFIGAQRRHRETWDGINAAFGLGEPGVLPGFNEFDFKGLLNARYAGEARPHDLHSDRKTHFKALRDTVLDWQAGRITDPPEPFDTFAGRVRDARARAVQGGEKVMVVTSGGAIGFSVAEVMGAPADAMIRLQLQIKNCAVTRIVATSGAEHLSTFNETPHIDSDHPHFLTYS
jgi:broad specificity phosphatase PhoE